MRPQRVFAGYLMAQAALGVVLWVTLAASPTVRSWFELMPTRHEVMDAFAAADVAVVVVGSAAGARALWTGRPWGAPVVAFTAGGVVYPTIYLLSWVSFAGSGALCLAVMVPVSTVTCWIAYQVGRHRH
jgi:hypothetical protein